MSSSPSGGANSRQQRLSTSFELRPADGADVSTTTAVDWLLQSPGITTQSNRVAGEYGSSHVSFASGGLTGASKSGSPSRPISSSTHILTSADSASVNMSSEVAKQSASSVVLAFRELQARAKQIEYDRIAAQAEVDELRRKLSEAQRSETLHRSKLEMGYTDEVLRIREKNERILLETSDVQRNVARVTEESQRLHREIATQRARAAALTDEYAKGEAQTKSLELRIIELRQDIESIDLRCGTLERKIVQSHSAHQRVVESSMNIDELTTKLTKEKAASVRVAVRLSALQRYLDIVLQINADLTESLKTREATSHKIFNIVERETRKYAFDRDRSYELSGSRGSPTRATAALATARAVNETLIGARSRQIRKGTAIEDRSYQKALEIINGATSVKTGPKRTTKKKIVSKASNNKSVNSSVGGRSVEYTPQRTSQSLHRMYVDDNYEAALLKELDEARMRRDEISRYNEHQRARGVVARSEEAVIVDDLMGGYRPSGRPPAYHSRHHSTTGQRRSIDGTEDSLASINSSRSSWMYNPSNLDNLPTKSPERVRGAMSRSPERSRRRSTSASSNRSQSSGKQRLRSRSLSIGDDSMTSGRSFRHSHEGSPADLVRSAARLAATAVATQAVAAANIDNAEAKRVFLPSSAAPSQHKEFNVVASVSKAARSARELNAALASR